MSTNNTSLWSVLAYRDAPAAIDFLTKAFGFEATAVYPRDGDGSVIEHAELRWPLGGGVMLGSAGKDDSPFGRRAPGNDSVYAVCDDADGLFDRAVATGAEVVRGLADEDYGSRGFTVRDPEGNLWSFGTYRGEETAAGDSVETFARLIDDWAAAIVANDASRIEEFATPDWQFVTPTGIFSGKQMLSSVASGDLTHDSMSHDVVHATRLGAVAIVVSRCTNTGAYRGEPFVNDEWTTDVFVRDGERWRCLQTHLTPAAHAS